MSLSRGFLLHCLFEEVNSIRLMDRMADDSFLLHLSGNPRSILYINVGVNAFTRTNFSCRPTFTLCGWIPSLQVPSHEHGTIVPHKQQSAPDGFSGNASSRNKVLDNKHRVKSTMTLTSTFISVDHFTALHISSTVGRPLPIALRFMGRRADSNILSKKCESKPE